MKSKKHSIYLILKTFFISLFNSSDYERWKNINSIKENWSRRTEIMASFIEPNSKVLEFGAGRMILRDFLPECCDYVPSDLVCRGKGTIVYDINDYNNFPFTEYFDVVFLSGVLEYVHNVSCFIKNVSQISDLIVCSYATKELNSNGRLKHGWLNNYGEQQLENLFKEYGYTIKDKTYWSKQVLYKFGK